MKNDDIEQARLTELLNELSSRDARSESPVRVERAVMARWAERHADSPLPITAASRPVSSLTSRWPQAAMGLAGIAAMVVLVVWGLDNAAEAPPPHVPAVQEASSVEELDPFVFSRSPEPGVLFRNGSKSSTVAAANPEPATTAERLAPADVEPFVRLLPITEQELAGIRLARVRMRGQAAQTLGLDLRIPAPGADGFVEADVLLGEDGLARAIRFVR